MRMDRQGGAPGSDVEGGMVGEAKVPAEPEEGRGGAGHEAYVGVPGESATRAGAMTPTRV